jgi:Ankyrin repeats (many copies)
VNAASKGHLPVVRYLLAKQSANPLIRNNWGETAFDIAAAVFEIFICQVMGLLLLMACWPDNFSQVLQQAEAQAWRALGSITPYNPLAAHSTVPLIIYEHQRLDTRFKTLAVNGGRPRFSTYHLGRPGRPAPFELLLWGGESLPVSQSESTSGRIPAWRSNVQLPFLDDAFTLPPPNVTTIPRSRDGAERSHFWM